MKIEFTVPAVPVAQPRAKATVRGGFARVYNDSKHPVNDFKASVRMAFRGEFAGPPLHGPLAVRLVFVFPRASNKFWKSKAMPRYVKETKPDIDNLAKSVLDSLNKIAFQDDGQVATMLITKCHAAGDEPPHVEVEINTL